MDSLDSVERSTFSEHMKLQYLIALENYNLAEELAEQILESNVGDPDILALLCSAKLKAGEFSAALEVADRALEHNPFHMAMLRLKAEALGDLGYHKTAVEASLTAVALNPTSHLLYQDLGRHRFNMAVGQGGEERESSLRLARRDFSEAVRLSGPDPYLHTMLGCVEMALGDFGAADAHLIDALRIDPKSPSTHLMKGRLLIRMERYSEADYHLRRSYQIDTTWETEARDLQAQIAARVEADNKVKRALPLEVTVWGGYCALFSLLAFFPVFTGWVMFDALTGYFPPLYVAALSVPIVPLVAYFGYDLLIKPMVVGLAEKRSLLKVSDTTQTTASASIISHPMSAQPEEPDPKSDVVTRLESLLDEFDFGSEERAAARTS